MIPISFTEHIVNILELTYMHHFTAEIRYIIIKAETLNTMQCKVYSGHCSQWGGALLQTAGVSCPGCV